MTTMSERLQAIQNEALPAGYFTAEHLADDAKARLAEMRPAEPVSADPFAGDDINQWLNETLEHEAQQSRLNRRHELLLYLKNSASKKADTLRNNATPTILRAYQAELTALLGHSAQVSDELGRTDTAEKAVHADRAPQWKQLATLADDYGTLRRAQLNLYDTETIYNAKPKHGGEPHASDLFLRNLDDLWPEWRNPNDAGRVDLSGKPRRYEPWPQDPTQLLLWLVRSDAEPWIPTEDDLETLRQQRIAKRNPLPKVERGTSELINAPLPTHERRTAPKLVAAQPKGDTE